MSNNLCLRFYEPEVHPASALSWVVLSPSAEVVDSGQALLGQLLAALPEDEQYHRTMVMVPASAILLTTIELPEKQRRHVKQVLPFVVEEQLIDPVESMHLATPVLMDAGEIQVAAVKRKIIANWLDQLNEVQIHPDFVFADACCIPARRGNWQLLFERDRLLFKGTNSGMALSYPMAKSVLRMSLSTATESDIIADEEQQAAQAQELLLIVPDSRDADALESCRQAAGQTDTKSSEALEEFPSGDVAADQNSTIESATAVQKTVSPQLSADEVQRWQDEIDTFARSENLATHPVHYRETATELLAVNALQTLETQLNLLQGDFRPSNANAQNRRFMHRIAMGVAACLAAFLVVSLGGGFYLNYRADSYFDKSVAIYRGLFPKQRRVIDPVKQLKRQLKGQAVGGTTSEFLPLLDAASRSLATLEEQSAVDASIKQLRYDMQRGNIAIDIHASNIDELEAYKDLLAQEGLDVDILSANQDGDVVKGRLQIGRS